MDKLQPMTSKDANKIFKKAQEESNTILYYRLGQSFFNNLPDEYAAKIRATQYDPFYNDKIIDSCIEFLTNPKNF